MALDVPPVNNEGKKIVQLCRCPYAQLTCHQCINTCGGKSWDPLGRYVWMWDCLLCQEEFTTVHMHTRHHLKQEGHLTDQLQHQIPDIRYWDAAEKSFWHEATGHEDHHTYVALTHTPARPGGAPRIMAIGWHSPFTEQVRTRERLPTVAHDLFDHVPYLSLIHI